jgi:hypothetical protein
LLDRYLFFQTIYFLQDSIQAEDLIGREKPCLPPDKNRRVVQNQEVERSNNRPAINVTLHLVRGTYLVRERSGTETRVYERVTKDFSDLLGEELDPAYLYLYHGTTIEKATAIVKNGPDVRLGAADRNFNNGHSKIMFPAIISLMRL